MTQSSLQTQCPKCHTRFRVSDEQLGVAKGKVRCGNCMEVFNAFEHRVMPSSPPAPSGGEAKPSDLTTEEDFVFADNPDEDAEEGRYAGSKLSFSDDELSDSFLSINQNEKPGFRDADEDSEPEEVDESWAEAILEEDEKPRQPGVPKQPAPSQPYRDEAAPTFSAREPEPETPEREPEQFEPRPAEPEAEPARKPGRSADRPTPEPAFSATDTSGVEPVESGFRPERTEAPAAESMRATAPFSDLRREPDSVNKGRDGKARTILWSLIVIALLGVLVAQMTWFQFDRLSAIPELRPFYEKGCELAGCELKPLVNVDAIQSRKLVVRTDPENRGQLLVDAVIINRADFGQPFPAIALTFSNLNGDVVAQSVFTPDEYLAGEARELDSMPTDTPVRIAISIRDPGRDAVNYNLNFRPYAP
ncbi:DUF3426 domain-containing protein [Marinobacter sp. DUT-1]|uniref:DUF3426 domain-containing protein n=1 Tax=Marinobacter sp. DUT-1 TaxID=3412037 RepID=UPI003D17BBD4